MYAKQSECFRNFKRDQRSKKLLRHLCTSDAVTQEFWCRVFRVKIFKVQKAEVQKDKRYKKVNIESIEV